MRLALIVLLVLASPVVALSFTEDFEDDSVGTNPEGTFYTYSENANAGYVTDVAPIADLQSFQQEGSGTVTFALAGPTQLTDLDFSIKGQTIDDNGVGSRQVIKIQSQSPTRTLVEFYLLCDDAANSDGCDLNVKFENVDTLGQTLVPSSAGDSSFDIEINPTWAAGTYQLTVDAVDDGNFPFLELPSNIGKLVIAKPSGVLPVNLTLDDWFIDGATDAVAAEGGDIANGLKNWATDINFTSGSSLFLLGLVVFCIVVLAVAVPLLALGMDNTVLPALTFFTGLTTLWLVDLGWWPSWVGIAVIILVSALISLIVRRLLMGIKNASTNVGVVTGALGYFIVCTSLLGFSGYATESIEVPTSSLETPDDVNETVDKQSFSGAVTECLITFFSDCSQDTVSTTWATITDVASTIFNFARTAFTFLFQLLTFSLPIPVIFNTMIVLPPAAALATVGFSFITRSG